MTYEIYRLTPLGWSVARLNIIGADTAARECAAMRAEDPKLKLRIIEVTRTTIFETE